jgi:hypothetical protein
MFIDEIRNRYLYKPLSVETLDIIKCEIENYIRFFTIDDEYQKFYLIIDDIYKNLNIRYYNLATAILLNKKEIIPYNHDRYEDEKNKYYLVNNQLIIESKLLNPCSEIPKLSKNELEISILKEKVKSFSIG